MTQSSPQNQPISSLIESMEGVLYVQLLKSFIYIPRG